MTGLVGQAVMRLSLEQEIGGSNLGPLKSDTVLAMAHHHCKISSKGAVARRWAPPTRYTLRHITANKMKDFMNSIYEDCANVPCMMQSLRCRQW